ncbi:MAG TPA: glycosyltransferase family 4 protein [Verrucomicrobiae bacterium]|jgi:colanic acid biosynthesis glycosyl transferase WcaI|nr:glycosyltransferase family 4 protein [Verrucomicrobiae bacterium]
MRILLLNLYYPPDTSATAKMTATVAEALSARHDVTVLCGRPSYDPAERRPWRLSQTELAGRVKIVRVGSTDYPRFQMKRRVLNYLSYVALAIPRALFLPCDAVLAMTDPPFEGIVGATVAMLKGKPYVYNIRDMYPDMAVGGAIVRPGLLARIWERLHRWALRRATRVIVLGEDMRARIIRKGVDAVRVEIVRDGADIPPFDAAEPLLDGEIVRTIRGDFRFVLLHAGNLGFYGAWETLITAVRELGADGVGLVFVGEGAQRAHIEALAGEAKNVRFLPFFPANKIPSVLAAADAHVVTVKRGLEGVVVPSKLYGILAAGKPILAVAPEETDAASLGAKFGFAVSADPDRPEEVVAAIRSLVGDQAKVQNMARAARAVAPDYDRVKELQKFVKIIEGAVKA